MKEPLAQAANPKPTEVVVGDGPQHLSSQDVSSEPLAAMPLRCLNLPEQFYGRSFGASSM
jgi:hypothetical protein